MKNTCIKAKRYPKQAKVMFGGDEGSYDETGDDTSDDGFEDVM